MIGLRYRWMQLGEMDIYTKRQLHALSYLLAMNGRQILN